MRRLSPLALALMAAAAPARGQNPRPDYFEVVEATIPQLQAAMARGEVTSVQLVDAYLARIAAYDSHGPALNSLIRLNPKARDEAAALDAERKARGPRGPLHGIPVILKDNYDTADLPTSGGSIALANSIPPEDAFVVKRLRAAGVVILGKSNMHELAAGITTISSLGGQTRNAYDPRRCPGGSSGGTGAAIAASFAAVGWGTDTCGSIRIPAAFGSLFGLRPTHGFASRSGIIPLSHTQDVPGPLARTVTDLAIALDVTLGPDPADTTTAVLDGRPLPRFEDSLRAGALRGARLGVLRNYFTDMDDDVARALRGSLSLLAANGAEVVDVAIPDFDSLLAGTRAIDLETKFDLMDYFAGVPASPVRSLSDILARGLYHAALESRWRRIDTLSSRESDGHRAVLAKQAALRAAMVRVLDSLQLDALLYPTMQRKPAFIGEPQAGSTCQLSAGSGLPALSAPAGFTTDGLPVGLEMLGRPFADLRLVQLAYGLEQAGPGRRPPATTPPLVNGRAPAPRSLTVHAGAATARLTLDATRLELHYQVRSALPAERLSAVVLQRVDSAGSGAVVYRLAGPGAIHAAGTLQLDAGDVAALEAGRYLVTLFTADQPAGVASRVSIPR